MSFSPVPYFFCPSVIIPSLLCPTTLTEATTQSVRARAHTLYQLSATPAHPFSLSSSIYPPPLVFSSLALCLPARITHRQFLLYFSHTTTSGGKRNNFNKKNHNNEKRQIAVSGVHKKTPKHKKKGLFLPFLLQHYKKSVNSF